MSAPTTTRPVVDTAPRTSRDAAAGPVAGTVAEPELRLTRELVAGARGQAVAIGLLALVSVVATLVLPLVVGALISAVQSGDALTGAAALLVAAGLASALSAALATYLLCRLGERLVHRLRCRVVERSLRMDLASARTMGVGDLCARLTADALQVKAAVNVLPIQVPMAALTLVGTLTIMAFLDWVLLLVTLAGFTVAAVAVAVVVLGLRRRYARLQDGLGALAEQYVTTMDALVVVKSARAEEQAGQELSDRAGELRRLGNETALMESLMVPAINLGQQVALVSVLIGGGSRLVSGELTLAELVTFLLYLLQLAAPLVMATSAVSLLQTAVVARGRFSSVLSVPVEGTRADRSPHPAPAPAPVPGAPAVQLREVHHRFGTVPTLRGVDLTVPAVGLTAVVGPSGAGKSTALALVNHLLVPDRGTVHLFGHDVESLALEQVRRTVSYVDQPGTLLTGTLRGALTPGLGAVTDERLLDVLERVGLREDVLALPAGLDSPLGHGSDLSGGQRQRLALARALLEDSPVILLDEPSSQLDSVNEERLRRLVAELARERAVVVVAHRMSTVREAGHVVVMETGRVVGQGPHDELMTTCPTYAELVLLQSGATPTPRTETAP